MNQLIIIFLILLLQFCSFPLDKTNQKNFLSLLAARTAIFNQPINTTNCAGGDPNQFTPCIADWSTFESKVKAAGITSHDPDSVPWVTKAQWDAAKWDGTTIYNPTTMTRAQFGAAICPTGDTIRGIREVFYTTKPFKDNKNPTRAEVDEWHRIAINHFRALVGLTAPERQVQKDHCMFKRALWADERQHTRKWDRKYPGNGDSGAGPCTGESGPHCGFTFVPSASDQAPYFSGTPEVCAVGGGAEGITGAPKSNAPWSIKWSRGFCSYLTNEGYWGGHVGPFIRREKFGFNFWDTDPGNNNSNALFRGQWTGKLLDHGYPEP